MLSGGGDFSSTVLSSGLGRQWASGKHLYKPSAERNPRVRVTPALYLLCLGRHGTVKGIVWCLQQKSCSLCSFFFPCTPSRGSWKKSYCEGGLSSGTGCTQAVESLSLETQNLPGYEPRRRAPGWSRQSSKVPSQLSHSVILFISLLCACVDDNRFRLCPLRRKITGGRVIPLEIQEGSWPSSWKEWPHSYWE